jgi:hypothetical protein
MRCAVRKQVTFYFHEWKRSACTHMIILLCFFLSLYLHLIYPNWFFHLFVLLPTILLYLVAFCAVFFKCYTIDWHRGFVFLEIEWDFLLLVLSIITRPNCSAGHLLSCRVSRNTLTDHQSFHACARGPELIVESNLPVRFMSCARICSQGGETWVKYIEDPVVSSSDLGPSGSCVVDISKQGAARCVRSYA